MPQGGLHPRIKPVDLLSLWHPRDVDPWPDLAPLFLLWMSLVWACQLLASPDRLCHLVPAAWHCHPAAVPAGHGWLGTGRSGTQRGDR